jgi:hypothetical protein
MSPYGHSKLMAEIMLEDLGAAHGLNYAILRYFNVAGADPRASHRPGDGRQPRTSSRSPSKPRLGYGHMLKSSAPSTTRPTTPVNFATGLHTALRQNPIEPDLAYRGSMTNTAAAINQVWPESSARLYTGGLHRLAPDPREAQML